MAFRKCIQGSCPCAEPEKVGSVQQHGICRRLGGKIDVNQPLYIQLHVHLLVVFTVLLSRGDILTANDLKLFLHVPVILINSPPGELRVKSSHSHVEEPRSHDVVVHLNLRRVRVPTVHAGVEHGRHCLGNNICTF